MKILPFPLKLSLLVALIFHPFSLYLPFSHIGMLSVNNPDYPQKTNSSPVWQYSSVIPAALEAEEDHTFKASLGKGNETYLKNRRVVDFPQVIEHLPNICQALGSSQVLPKKKRERETDRDRERRRRRGKKRGRKRREKGRREEKEGERTEGGRKDRARKSINKYAQCFWTLYF
jgi:hypothetical protein